jgi:phage-related protein
MKGITFGSLHSFNNLHLILSQKTIGTPSPKREVIDIPGGDGVLDLTEFFGAVKYSNRQLSFEFSTMVPQSQFMDLFAQVQNALHGQKMNIILDDDPEWFYVGRITVSEWKAEKNIGKLTIDCDCEPFKQSIYTTTVTKVVSSNATISLANDKMPTVPTITTTKEFLISFGGYNDMYPAGTFTIPELELWEGNNQVYVEGSGTITFTYRKGRL